jgi:hypothetical protein
MSHEADSPSETTREPEIADAIVDVARAWTDVGLAHATLALESTSHALERTAAAIALVRERLRRASAKRATSDVTA